MIYYLNIGTNLGDKRANLRRAIAALTALAGGCQVSPVVQSEPWGYESANRFLNVGVALSSDLAPQAMLRELKQIERQLGSQCHRKPDGTYADRLIDIDIMDTDGPAVNLPDLRIPHPHLHERPFFLEPLAFLTRHGKCNKG